LKILNQPREQNAIGKIGKVSSAGYTPKGKRHSYQPSIIH